MASPNHHERFLRDNLVKYRNKDAVKRDILTALHSFQDLVPRRDKFYSADGKCKDLVKVEGTIPVTFQGTKYHIPVVIWLDEAHPHLPPMCFVQPTSTMVVKSGRHVDASGRIYLPYLHEWKQGTSDLLGLIQVMCIIFGEQPPVFSRTAASQPWLPSPQQTAAGQPPPPRPQFGYAAHPPGHYPRQGMPAGQHRPSGQPGPQPPYPAGSYPTQQHAPYPVQPMMPAPVVGSQQWGHSPVLPRGGYAQPNPGQLPYPGGSVLPPPGPVPPTTEANSLSATNRSSGAHLSTVTAMQPLPTSARPRLKSEPSVPDETLRASLVTAVEDKLKQRLKETFSTAEIEMTQLRSTQEQLRTGGSKLHDMIQRMQHTQVELEEHIEVLQKKDSEMQDMLQRLEDSPEVVNIDQAVVPTAPLYRQILDLIAEDNAIEDTIYYLGEALRKNAVTLDVFLRNVRELSRRQFFTRALIRKAEQVASFPS